MDESWKQGEQKKPYTKEYILYDTIYMKLSKTNLWLQPWNYKTVTSWKESYDQTRQHIKNQTHYFANKVMSLPTKVCLVKAMVFPVVMYGCDSWTIKRRVVKNWCFWTVVLEKTLESPLNCKEIKSVNSKGNQSWIFIARTDAEAETPIFWPPDAKNWLIGKDPDAGKDWRWEEKGTTEDEMVGWHHQLHGHEFEQPLGVGDGQRSLVYWSPWDRRVGHNWDWTEMVVKTVDLKQMDIPFSRGSSPSRVRT